MSKNTTKDILALGVSASKMTVEKFYESIVKFLKQKELGEIVEEKLPYKDFNTPGGVSLVNVQITEYNLSSFEQTAKDNNILFSLKKDISINYYHIVFQSESREQTIKALYSYESYYKKTYFKEKEMDKEQLKDKKPIKEKTREITPSFD